MSVEKCVKDQFFKWISGKVTSNQLADIYIMCDEIEQYCINKGILTAKLFEVTNVNIVNKVSRIIVTDKKFREQHKRGLNKIRGIIYYYICFLKEYSMKKNVSTEIVEQLNKQDNKLEDVKIADFNAKRQEAIDDEYNLSDEDINYELILKEDYENGFRVKSVIDKGRFRVFYKERFGTELLLSDEQLIQTLLKIGTLREERIYAKQGKEQKELLKQIYDKVVSVFEAGVSCVYEKSIYDRYSIELAGKLHIYDSEELGDRLLEMSQGKLRRKHTFLCLMNGKSNLEQDVLNILKKSPIPLKYEEINKSMWYVPIDKIKQVMVNIKSIVYVAPETYFYAPNLPVSQEELMDIKRLIYKELETRTHITDVELRTMIVDKCPSAAINTADFTTYGLRNSLGYIFRDAFAFNGPIISAYGKELGMAEVFTEYCQERERVTTEELKALASEMNTTVYWDNIREVTVRISDKILLRDDKIYFDIESIDSVLEKLCDKDYVPLKDIGLFMHFPSISVPWNGYVLESFLYKYSKKFKLLHAGFSASGYFGAMVRKECVIDDYRALIVDALAHSKKWINKSTALDFLVREGYQQKKSYADIEKVIFEAKLLNEKIEETVK